MARQLLRLLRYLEVRGHFVVVSAYVRTYHNQLQEFLPREIQQVVNTEMHRLGYVRAESAGPWEEVFRRGYGRRVHALPGVDGDDWQLASQLAHRHPGPVTAQLEDTSWSGVKIVELLHPGPGEGGYTRGATRLGATPLDQNTRENADYVVGSLTPDGTLRQARSLLQEAERRGAGWIICDAPPPGPRKSSEFQKNDWCVALDPRMFAELCDPIAQRRAWCLAPNQSQLPDEEWLREHGAVREFFPPMTQALDEPGMVRKMSGGSALGSYNSTPVWER